LKKYREIIAERVAAMPTHQEFLDMYCPANRNVWGQLKD
jgi:hypothetical protein